MTDSEIIKALRCCYREDGGCQYCPLWKKDCSSCVKALIKLSFDLINRKDAEIINRTEEYNDMLHQRNKVEEALELKTMDVNSLESERDALQEMVKEQKAEIERLKDELAQTEDAFNKIYKMNGAYSRKINTIKKSEAIKEFAERLKEKAELLQTTDYFDPCIVRAVRISVIDNLVKEMVGDDK